MLNKSRKKRGTRKNRYPGKFAFGAIGIKTMVIVLVAFLAIISVVMLRSKKSELRTQLVTSNTAILSWTANTESDLAGYKIYYGTSPRTNPSPGTNKGGYNGADVPITVGKVTTYTVSNLLDNQTYYFSITAIDTSGNESPFSAEVSKSFAPTLTCDQIGKGVYQDSGGDVFNLLDVTEYERRLLGMSTGPTPDINGDTLSNHTDFVSLMQCVGCLWDYKCW